MAEQTFKSPGFFEKEVDLSERAQQSAGTPACIIGTAKSGPAFIPVTIGSIAEFESIFGELRSGQVAERNKRFKQPNNPSIKKSKVLYSRIIPLSPDERAASILDYLDPETGKPIFSSSPGSETLVSFANKLLQLRGTID